MMLRTASGSTVPDSMMPEAGEEDRAAQDAEIVAAPPGDQGAAEHDHGNRREQVGVAHAVERLGAEAREEDADQRGAEAAQHVGADDGEADALTPERRLTRGLLPTAKMRRPCALLFR